MDILTHEDLRMLLDKRDEFCVSLYMPTQKAGDRTQENPIRFKNLIKEVEKRFEAFGADKDDVANFLKLAHDLEENFEFWQHQDKGLAFFMDSDRDYYYRLPLEFQDLVVVTDRFHVKPLLPLMSVDGVYYVLAAGLKNVRLFRGTRQQVEQVDLKGLPTSLKDALWFDDDERSLQYHTAVSLGGGGEKGASYHGQGDPKDRRKNKISRFFKEIDRGIRDFMAEQNAPLILAGVDYLLPIYQEVNSYHNLLTDGVPGNPSDVSVKKLHQRSWTIAESHFARQREQAKERYGHLSASSQTASDLEDIVKAAFEGRVEVLFVARHQQKWGFYYPDKHEVEVHDKRDDYDEDLLDFAAVHTLSKGGKVYVLPQSDIPQNNLIAAIYRV